MGRLSGRVVGYLTTSALLALTFVTSDVAAQQVAVAPSGDAAGNEWLTYGGNLFNQRYSSLNQITTANVGQLKGAWNFHTGAMSSGTSFESSPIVAGGIMYVTGPQSQVWALDARSGSQVWQYVPDYSGTAIAGISGVSGLPLCCGQVNR